MKLITRMLLVVLFLCITLGKVVLAQTRPSDTNNQPGTTAPTSKPPETHSPTAPPTSPPTSKPTTAPPTAPPTAIPTTPPPTPPPTPQPAVTTSPQTEVPTENSTNVTTPSEDPKTPNPSQVPSNSSKQSPSNGLSAGSVIAIVIVCLIFGAIVVFIIYRRNQTRSRESKDFDDLDASPHATAHFSNFEEDHKFSILEAPRSLSNTSDSHLVDNLNDHSRTFETEKPTNRLPSICSPHFSPESPAQSDIGDFTRSLNNMNNSPNVPPPNDRVSEAGSYAEEYRGTNQSFEMGMGRNTMNSTVDSEGDTTRNTQPAESHWMAAMDDDLRGTNDSYAMLEEGGSYGSSRGSGLRFSNDSDFA